MFTVIEDREDLVQNTIFQALACKDQYDYKKGVISAWLYGIMKNIYRNEKKRRKIFFTFVEQYTYSYYNPDLEFKNKMMLLINKLPEREKSAIIQHYFEDKEIKKIRLLKNAYGEKRRNRELKNNDKAIGMVLVRARKKLRKKISSNSFKKEVINESGS